MEDSVALSEFISILVESVKTDGLWATIGACIPLLAIVTFMGLGFYLIVKIIRFTIRAKGGM